LPISTVKVNKKK